MKLSKFLVVPVSFVLCSAANAGAARSGQFEIQGRIIGVAVSDDACIYTSEITLSGHIENHPVQGRGRSKSRALCNNEVIESRYVGVADVFVRVARGQSAKTGGHHFKAQATAFSQPLLNPTTGMVFDTWGYQMSGSLVAMEEEAADCLFLVDCDEPQPPTKPGPANPQPKPKPEPEEDCVAIPVLGMEEEAADC